jgi:hypothetical protein
VAEVLAAFAAGSTARAAGDEDPLDPLDRGARLNPAGKKAAGGQNMSVGSRSSPQTYTKGKASGPVNGPLSGNAAAAKPGAGRAAWMNR